MKLPLIRRILLAGFICQVFVCSELRAEVLHKSVNIGTAHLEYRVVLPKPYDPAREYPAVLAFGGGPQTIEGVDRSIQSNWRAEAERRGYIVVFPAAPTDSQGPKLYFQGGERVFPEFLEIILKQYRIRDGKLHIAGVSNGGISAFHIAALHPKYFLSITALPGFMPNVTEERVMAIDPLCIFMHVGEFDTQGWTPRITEQAEVLKKVGLKIHFTLEKGQEHRIETLAGKGAARLFDQFALAERGCQAE